MVFLGLPDTLPRSFFHKSGLPSTIALIFVRSIALLLMIFRPDRSTNVCNNLIVSWLARHNFDHSLRRFLYRFVQNLYQTLESPQSTPTIASSTLFDILIVWIRLRLHDPPSDQSRPLIIFINLPLFFPWHTIAVRCIYQQQIHLKFFMGFLVWCLF